MRVGNAVRVVCRKLRREPSFKSIELSSKSIRAFYYSIRAFYYNSSFLFTIVTKSTGLGNKRYDYSPGLTRLSFKPALGAHPLLTGPPACSAPNATVIALLAVWVIVPTQSPPVPRLGDELPSGTPPQRATPKFRSPAPKHLKSFVTKSTGLG